MVGPGFERNEVMNAHCVEACRRLQQAGLRRFAPAMMWIMGFVFGLGKGKMLCEPDEKEGKYILNEVMQNGNMGHYDHRIKRVSKNAKIQSVAASLQHTWHLSTHYPSEFLWTPIWIVWHYVWKRTLGRV